MGTISDKLMRIINTKEDIRQALISKGYDVPTSIPFKEYAKMISDLPCRVDSFPDIEGIVARYSALGLTNEQMAANPVWVDKTGNGHDLQMKNFAWKEGSGISDIYPGALVFDGVDDYGTCDNFPILTKEKGYTVVALRKYITPDPKSYLISNGDTARLAAFLVEGNFPTIQYWNFGAVGNLNYIDNLPYVYQTSKEYNGRSINKGDLNEGIASLLVCKYGSWHSNAAIWEIVILDHDATEEELTKIKDYFVKTYPWLFPDQAWTVTGKTNEDEDRATISNITGNGNDLVLSNFAFSGNSGYGSYVYNFNDISTWIYYSYNGTIEITSSTIHVTEAKTARPFFEKNTFRPGYNKVKIKVTGIKDGEILKFMSDEDIDNTINIEKDGIYSLPGSDKLYYGFRLSNPTNTYPFNCDITIEQIPEYEGYLVTDGVDDKAVSKQFKFGENFTVILDFKFPVKKIAYCGFDLSSKVRIQNLQGSGVYVVLKGNKTLIPSNVVRAVTSEGKVYDENWNEYNIVPGNISSNYTMVNLGFDGSNQFAESATKLAGIYSSALSKDDCIKAYNYLQTLKSK